MSATQIWNDFFPKVKISRCLARLNGKDACNRKSMFSQSLLSLLVVGFKSPLNILNPGIPLGCWNMLKPPISPNLGYVQFWTALLVSHPHRMGGWASTSIPSWWCWECSCRDQWIRSLKPWTPLVGFALGPQNKCIRSFGVWGFFVVDFWFLPSFLIFLSTEVQWNWWVYHDFIWFPQWFAVFRHYFPLFSIPYTSLWMIIFQSGCLHGSFNKDVSEKSNDLLCCVYCGGAKAAKAMTPTATEPTMRSGFLHRFAMLCYAADYSILWLDCISQRFPEYLDGFSNFSTNSPGFQMHPQLRNHLPVVEALADQEMHHLNDPQTSGWENRCRKPRHSWSNDVNFCMVESMEFDKRKDCRHESAPEYSSI